MPYHIMFMAASTTSSDTTTTTTTIINEEDSSKNSSFAIIAAYEHYLRLPELSALWTTKQFPEWDGESLIKPALQALEITFSLIPIAILYRTPHWTRRIESLASRQIELIAALLLVLNDDCSHAPLASSASASGGNGASVLSRDRSRTSSDEVWNFHLPSAAAAISSVVVVSRPSEGSLLPRLANWDNSSRSAANIQFHIEAGMRDCPFTLGLGEPNLAGKSNLRYDAIVRPADLHALEEPTRRRRGPHHHLPEAAAQAEKYLYTIHQILESWLCAATELLRKIELQIDNAAWEAAAGDCWLLERIWKLLAEIEDLMLLVDPDGFLSLKTELAIRSAGSGPAFCFRSAALTELARGSRELRRKVPRILGVEVDPNGGPRVQQAAMGLFHNHHRSGEDDGRVHLLQAFQAVEGAVKKFFFAYRQVVTTLMGSVEATGNQGLSAISLSDPLSQMFLEPPYFPSIDAAKTFLGEMWQWQSEHPTRV